MTRKLWSGVWTASKSGATASRPAWLQLLWGVICWRVLRRVCIPPRVNVECILVTGGCQNELCVRMVVKLEFDKFLARFGRRHDADPVQHVISRFYLIAPPSSEFRAPNQPPTSPAMPSSPSIAFLPRPHSRPKHTVASGDR